MGSLKINLANGKFGLSFADLAPFIKNVEK